MTDNDALNQTRDALHIAFTLIANARNSLDNNVSNRDPVLADQWHEAAARFMQDYNANLDVYTGYRCYTDECSGTCGAGRPLSWHLNPAAVLAALDGDSDE